MSSQIIVQYLGFQAKPQVREYTFNVREAGIEREFTLKIANEAFVTHRARYQDAPAICSLRLNAELASHSNHPQETQFVITTAELDDYRDSRAPKPSGSSSGWKKAQDDF
ncbi:MAG TPA: hypothetical protein VE077_14780 [Candidatus Methylomirabilis sp.]|nr:hypothetical protein [Candidatus Methylomirabilis sp.]